MKIIVDAMGGDNAPEATVKGAIKARRELGTEIVLVGRKEDIEHHFGSERDCGITVVDARDVVTMEDDPSSATRRKKDSSMSVALELLRSGDGDAVVSAGSTGALLTGATLTVKRVRGIRRAALAPVLPNGKRGTVLIDCGANVECTAEYLLQFAFMGSFYARKILGCYNPRIGLLNNGTEEHKGGTLQHQAYALLKKADSEGRINFVGNVEASQALSGDVDVLVADGFTGNILLKTCEGVAKYINKGLKGVFKKNLKNKLAASVLKEDIVAFKDTLDANRVGGTALLGINKPVIKAHGSSNEEAIFSAIRQAVEFCSAGVIGEIENNIEYMRLPVMEAQGAEERT
ncbi:MAG: phosphate acyltransferase PlsX [Clostridia bacterium]|nr:phosphate acyltransferase PlsX [Clostridia bacterium]